MTDRLTSLYLVTPLVPHPEAIPAELGRACAGSKVAALLLRLAGTDERSLVNTLKAAAKEVQAHGTALILAGDAIADPVTVAGRGGADGIHVAVSGELREVRDRLKGDRVLGVGGLRSKHDAMMAGEAGADYVMFGEPRPDGSVPEPDLVIERARWWAEIFATPCVAFATSLPIASELAATGAEFVALGDAVWHHPEGIEAALAEAEAAVAAAVPA